MAKSLVRNQIAGRTFGFALPAEGVTAKTFCDNHLEGTYNVYEVESTSGNEVRVGEAERTKEQQEIYISQGKSKTSNSMHLKRCAIDLHIFKDNN